MTELKNGVVEISDDLIIKPGYSFEEFKKTKFYSNQDGIRIVELDDKVAIDEREYLADLFFRNGIIYIISLTCCDKVFSEIDEPKRKEYHDEILKSYGIDDKAEFEWGSIYSVYDSRGNASTINIEYKNRSWKN